MFDSGRRTREIPHVWRQATPVSRGHQGQRSGGYTGQAPRPKAAPVVKPVPGTNRPRTPAEVSAAHPPEADRRIGRDAIKLVLLGIALGFLIGLAAGLTVGYNYADRVFVVPLPGEGIKA